MRSLRTFFVTSAMVSALGLIPGAPASADQCLVKIGRVLPMTGALQVASLVHPWIDTYKIEQINKAGGLSIGGQQCQIEVKDYDSKSSPAGSGDAATKAIVEDHVNVVMASFTPDTTNQPTEACEKYEIPCITTSTPVEAWLYGPDGKPRDTEFSFHFFFSVADLVRNHVDTLKSIPGGFNGKIGYLYPSDPDGIVFHSLFDPAFTKETWQGVDPGRIEEGLADFTPIVNTFKEAGVEVVAGVLPPPDLANFLAAAAKSNFKPKFYLIDKATGFAEAMTMIGTPGENIAGADFWSAAYAGHARIGGYDALTLINTYQGANPGKYASPLLGLDDASYDVLFDALQRAASLAPDDIVKALKTTDIDTVAGHIKFNNQNYALIPIATGQWRFDAATQRWIKDTVYSNFSTVSTTGALRLYGSR